MGRMGWFGVRTDSLERGRTVGDACPYKGCGI